MSPDGDTRVWVDVMLVVANVACALLIAFAYEDFPVSWIVPGMLATFFFGCLVQRGIEAGKRL
jgi:hypothetical protein